MTELGDSRRKPTTSEMSNISFLPGDSYLLFLYYLIIIIVDRGGYRPDYIGCFGDLYS